ncbi:AraC family transcriptional regulator [Paenibacillus sp. HWE-109]|uniref:AraC family transcriptional regulator n=1 Tax=Paenibacillus sp. HWE-109 TaxID=1306526 RepID=UPI001EE02837|nr:AraC family transcriptional regulator [Paenibacillus sp. HWE-109]UKS27560.1 AraC family transcriptional regulator [Paenibacillus sp. HWE-109]
METWMNELSPWVRMVKIHKSVSLAGKWMDYDHVYTYIEQGEAEFFMDGITYQVQEGDVLLMPPFLTHLIRSTSPEPLIQYIVHFDLFYEEQRSLWKDQSITAERNVVAPNEMKFSSKLPIAHLSATDRMELKKRFLILHQEFLAQRPGYPLITKAICLELLVLFLRAQAGVNGKEGKVTKGWVFIEHTIKYINENFANPELDNASISSHAGVSTNHLSFLFKDQLGMTIHQYLTHTRIEQAKIRIMAGDQTLTAIAEQVGYSSIYLFSRSFKAHVGVMPSMFMAMNADIRKH